MTRLMGCIELRGLLILSVLVSVLAPLLLFPVEEGFALGESEVKFRGVATTDEEWGSIVAYGSYYCRVKVEEILFDPNNTLSLSDVVTVCYSEPLSLKTGDQIECYGLNFINSSCAKQFIGKIVCKDLGAYNPNSSSYYAIPEFPSLIILPLFMIATLLAAMVYRRKSKPEYS